MNIQTWPRSTVVFFVLVALIAAVLLFMLGAGIAYNASSAHPSVVSQNGGGVSYVVTPTGR